MKQCFVFYPTFLGTFNGLNRLLQLITLVGSNDCYDRVRHKSCYDKAGRNSCYDEAGLNSCYNKAGRNSYYNEAGRIGILLRILPDELCKSRTYMKMKITYKELGSNQFDRYFKLSKF